MCALEVAVILASSLWRHWAEDIAVPLRQSMFESYASLLTLQTTFVLRALSGCCVLNRQGGELAVYDDYTQELAVADGMELMVGMFVDRDDFRYQQDYWVNFWLGYQRPRNSQVWVNTQGLQQDKWPHQNWRSEEPSAGNSPGLARCALQQLAADKGERSKSTWGWIADSCDKETLKYETHGVVCRLVPVGECCTVKVTFNIFTRLAQLVCTMQSAGQE
jgi:hypothetical protein